MPFIARGITHAYIANLEANMQSQPEKTQPTPSRVPYRTPKLVKYGKLASLVQGGTSGISNFEDTLYTSVLG